MKVEKVAALLEEIESLKRRIARDERAMSAMSGASYGRYDRDGDPVYHEPSDAYLQASTLLAAKRGYLRDAEERLYWLTGDASVRPGGMFAYSPINNSRLPKKDKGWVIWIRPENLTAAVAALMNTPVTGRVRCMAAKRGQDLAWVEIDPGYGIDLARTVAARAGHGLRVLPRD